jgi:hypothetical protein
MPDGLVSAGRSVAIVLRDAPGYGIDQSSTVLIL